MKFDGTGLDSIIGLNKRNLDIISVHNKRANFPIVDDKIKTKEYLKKGDIPYPETICVIHNFFEIETSLELLLSLETFVVKPSRGRAGGGILLLEKSDSESWKTPSGRSVNREDLLKHFGDILFGVYSFGLSGDSVLVERRVYPHKIFTDIYQKGVADIRFITLDRKSVV